MNKFQLKNHYFIWQGISTQGKKMTGEISALNINHATINLKQQGINLLSIRKKRKSLFNQTKKKISELDISLFFRQLATLNSSGISLVQSLAILNQSQENTQLQILIKSLKNEIEAGKNFVTGLKKFPNYFDELICYLIYAGELSGTLDIMLQRIARYKEKSIALKKQIKQAFFYPAIIFIIAIAVSLIMLIFIIPRFAELFQHFQDQLPAFTKIILNISAFIQKKFEFIFIFILLSMISVFSLKKSSAFKHTIDRAMIKFPFIGNIIKKIILARFARSLAITYSAGIPITEALKIVADICCHNDYTKAVINLRLEVMAGIQLNAAMQPIQLFPPLIVQMIKIGEESGTLEHMLEKIADLYESDIDHLIINLSYLLEPLIMIILGVLIGGLVIAMYLPVFKIGSVI